MMKLRYTAPDAERLFQDMDISGSGKLTLFEVDANCADQWAAFRNWAVATFASKDDMVSKLRGNLLSLGDPGSRRRSIARGASVEQSFNQAQFTENAPRYGWYGSYEDMLFECLDMSNSGFVSEKDIPWFGRSLTKYTRRLALRQSKTVKRVGTGPSSIHVSMNCMRCLLSFISLLRAKSEGSLMRSWRTLLDREGKLVVQRPDVVRAGIELGWRGDTNMLWGAIAGEYDAVAPLEALGFKEARSLALFRRWALTNFNSIKGCWSKLLASDKVRKKERSTSVIKISLKPHDPYAGAPTIEKDHWHTVCDKMHVGDAFDPSHIWSVLDWEAYGKLGYKDLKFLESWEPSSWILEEIDENESAMFKENLFTKYDGKAVKAWRQCLDGDGNGMCRYHEFVKAADRMKWEGNIARAWLGFDKRKLGFITLREIDEVVAEHLASFRRWCYFAHGGVAVAFEKLDTDGSGNLAEEEFIEIVKEAKFDGDAKEVWRALNPDDVQYLTRAEVAWLDDLEFDVLTAFVEATGNLAKSEAQQRGDTGYERASQGKEDLDSDSDSSTDSASEKDVVKEDDGKLLKTFESRVQMLNIVGMKEFDRNGTGLDLSSPEWATAVSADMHLQEPFAAALPSADKSDERAAKLRPQKLRPIPDTARIHPASRDVFKLLSQAPATPGLPVSVPAGVFDPSRYIPPRTYVGGGPYMPPTSKDRRFRGRRAGSGA
eukprot:TRINITY_DN15214_c0_g1_i1.p1 TRINITY_DN15214_c0_g1~~TRINITY_DN15214_c0_g1_i1.p1  ORF type:complete len:787 (+),score=156.97 TRINITY_DN15214_c0_g1_i1:217-2361(+)